MANLTNQYISSSFDDLLQIEGNGNVTNGLGTQPSKFVLTNVTASNLNVTAVNSDIVPGTDGLHDLGSVTKAWDNVYGKNISGSFVGDGSGLTGLTSQGQPGGPDTSVQFNDSGSLSGSADFTFDKTTGGVTAVSFTGSFKGDGSGLTNIGGAGQGFPFSGSAIITGSLLISGSSFSTNIGEAEDGDYTDGLFTDFVWSTPIGVAIDRINEVLRALAPAPAPGLGDIDVNTSGTTVNLSFGTLKPIATYDNVTVESGNDRGSKDLNESFTVGGTLGSTDMRYGAYGSLAARVGTLNESVASNGSPYVNYPANSFGDAEKGTLKLYVNNNVTPVVTLSLTDTPAATGSVNANGSGITVTATSSATFPQTGDPLTAFIHRQGTWTAGTGDQNNGYNWARVDHDLGTSTLQSYFVDWVNDLSSDTLSISNEVMKNYTPAGSNKISGVDYYTSATIRFAATASNAYQNTYSTSTSAISFSITNLSQTAGTVDVTGDGIVNETGNSGNVGMPDLGTNPSDETLDINVQTDLSFNATLYAPDDDVNVNVTVLHPLRSSGVSSTTAFNDVLLYKTLTNTDTDVENFLHESNRLIPDDYLTQANADSGFVWDSTQNLDTGDSDHNTGLLVVPFDSGRLVKPAYTGNGVTSGDFSAVTNGPVSNADYSGLTSTTTLRTHYFKLQNTTTSDLSQFTLKIKGSGTAVLATTAVASMTTNRFKIEFKCPERTGWLDCVAPRTAGLNSDGDGGLVGSSFTQPSVSGTTNQISVNVAGDACRGTAAGDKLIAGGEYLVFRITAREDWSGYIDEIEITEF